MNIAIFTDFFLPSLGGVQTSIVNQKRALENAGHKVIIFAPCYGDDTPFDEHGGIIRLPTIAKMEFDGHRSFLPLPKHSNRVTALLKDSQIDIIHIETEFSIGLLGLKLAKKHGIPVVYTSHTLLWKQVRLIHKHPGMLTAIARSYYYLYLRSWLPRIGTYRDGGWIELQWIRLVTGISCMADATVTPSHHLADKLAHSRNIGKVTVIPNTTDFDKVPAVVLPDIPVFLWVARLSPEKRPLEFIEALRIAARSSDHPYKAIICGSGPMQDECQQAAEGIPNLTFTSVTSYGDMPKLYDSASALVVTSYQFDNQPMTIAESLARRRGVIYCDPDLTADGLADGAGLLTGPSTEEIAKGIISVIENPDKLAMMSKISEAAANRFSERHYLSAIESVYQSLIQKDNPPPTS